MGSRRAWFAFIVVVWGAAWSAFAAVPLHDTITALLLIAIYFKMPDRDEGGA